jgi:hypothetical protein
VNWDAWMPLFVDVCTRVGHHGGLSDARLHGNRPQLFRETGPDAGVVIECVHIYRVAIMVELPADHILRMIGNELAAAGIDGAREDFGDATGGESHGIAAVVAVIWNENGIARELSEGVRQGPIVLGPEQHHVSEADHHGGTGSP